jgi:PAS domain S-box-containing protein
MIDSHAALPLPAAVRPQRRPRGTGRTYRFLLVAAVALPLALTSGAIGTSLLDAFATAEAEVTRTADGAAEYARRILDGHRMAADRINDRLLGLPDDEIRRREPELHAVLRSLVAETPQLRSAYVLDRHGSFLVSASAFPVRRDADMTDREHHVMLAADDAPASVVTRVYRGRYENNLFFAVAQRRRETGNTDLPPGAFDGQVNVSVDPEEVGAALRMLLGQPGDLLTLVRADGEVLARSQGYDREPPIRLEAHSPMLPDMRRGGQRGVVSGRSGIDGVWRMVAYRRVAGWPVYVAAGRSRAHVLRGWVATAMAQLAIGLPATGLLILLVLVVRRREAELEEANGALERHVADRTAALAESEARLRRVQRVGRVGGFEIDLRSGANLRSAEYMRVQGLAASDRIEGHAEWVARLHPEDRERAERQFLEATADDAALVDYAQEYRILTPGGEVRWIAARAEVERDTDGRALRMVGAHLDITELKAAQAAAAEGAARLHAALRGARFGIWERRLPGSAASWDARAAEIYDGMTPEATPDLAAWRDRVHPDDRADRLAAIEAAVMPGGRDSYDCEFRFRRNDGGWNHIVVHGAVVERDAATGHGVRLAGVVQDVSGQRAAEAALREREAWLRLAQEAGRIGSWEADPATGIRRWSQGTYRIWGLEPDSPVSAELLFSLIHPEDLPRVRDAVALLQEQCSGRVPDLAFRIRRASDGAERFLVSAGEVVPGPAGRGRRHLGIMHDVTEWHAVEAALRASEERLRLAQEAGGVGSWDWNLETGELYWSESCHRLHGTDPAVAPDVESWRDGIHPEDRPGVAAALGAALQGEAHDWAIEFRFIHRSDHSIRWIAGRGSILREPATGKAIRVRGVALDITAQKEAERLQRFLISEIDHRAKNALAVVHAAVRLTPKTDAMAYARAIEGRVKALARAHTLLAEGQWAGADLGTLVRGELAPFLVPAEGGGGGVPVVEIAGPVVQVSSTAAQGLSMALHELATNATKHGALSAPGGCLRVEWSVDDATRVLRLHWTERGGPTVKGPPGRRGFGTRVLEGTIQGQLGGTVLCRWEAAGLACMMTVPMERGIGASPEQVQADAAAPAA